MKKLTISITLFLLVFCVKAQVSITVRKTGSDINFGKVIRLSSATPLTGKQQKGTIQSKIKNDVILMNLLMPGRMEPKEFAGVFFNEIPDLKQGLTLWRYKPWNSWTKPVTILKATDMADWDVQFFYWQYKDGLYGAAVPLSGNGFRTTLGAEGNKWGSKAVSYADNKGVNEVPAMAIAFGKDPFELFSRIYKTSLVSMGKAENQFANKKLPEPFKYIGWCTWNSSENGKNLSEDHVVEGVKSFTDKKFVLGWVLIDDGWFQHKNSQLQSLLPDPEKFPNGFKPLVSKLKNEYCIKYTGIWHAFNGYWNGIDPDSPLGIEHKNRMFSWKQRENSDDPGSQIKTYYFLKPEGSNQFDFYNKWHKYLKNEGFDFIKVDNQLVAERMAQNNYPIFSLSEKMHKALYKSANGQFSGAVINCMDMTADAYFNFGSSAVARTVEDYFPYKRDENYNLQAGNAAAHILQGIYNCIYFSQMVFTDFDIFQSHNPNAVLHAITRTINNGPIYLTDKPGEQNFNILNRIAFSDGKSIRSETSLLPTEDCLFQVQEPRLFKAYSKVGNKGLLALYNAADADEVTGSFKAADVNGLKGNEFALYEYFSGKLRLAKYDESFNVSLPRMGYQLAYVIPIKNGFAPFGIIDKYNAPATIISDKWIGKKAEVILYEGGNFKAYSSKSPITILVNGKSQKYAYQDQMVTMDIDMQLKKPVLIFMWD
ncbi:MAG: alpha-galactosidase [Flavobacterium sp.]|nr:alpha-galactosidase [Pedobacter sp.]